jgi:peptidoglycan/LPS O-acetylase OafA/YrhL
MIVACMLSKTAYVFGWGYYLNIVLAGALILALADWRPGKFFAELDQRFGDLAYPIFLSHWLVAFVIATLISQGARNWVLLLETIPGVLLFSAILARVNAIYIEPKRRDVRHRSLERVEGNGVRGAVLAH